MSEPTTQTAEEVKENFKQIPEPFEDYEVNSQGKVRNIHTKYEIIHKKGTDKFQMACSDGKKRALTIEQIMNKFPEKPVVRKENYSYEHEFTQEERNDKASQLARSCAERSAIEDEKKSANSSFKDRLDSKQSEINLLSRHLNEGHEYITKTCEAHFNFDKGIKEYYYEGNKVGEAKLSASEYQLKADLFAE